MSMKYNRLLSKPPKLKDIQINHSSEVKYFEIVPDSKLNDSRSTGDILQRWVIKPFIVN